MANLRHDESEALGEDVSAETRILTRLAQIAAQLGESAVAVDAQQLMTRIGEGRFFVACIGQFKRGKSTLLNALVGDAVLPTGVVPVTAVPTVLRYGEQRAARVLIDGSWRTVSPNDLAQYVSEELNPENQRCVAGVEVFLPASLLAEGMCLADTPGIGSVFAGNTETTNDFIPQIDAALLVVGADPPISGEELALVKAVAANVGEILIVMNKIDRVSEDERRQASEFAARVIEAHLRRPVARIYEVSALNELHREGGSGDWPTLVGDLRQLASKAGGAITRSAAERGIRRFSTTLGRSVEERVRALSEPIERSEQRISRLRQTAAQAEQSLRDLSALFSAEQMRVSNALLARRKKFFRETLPVAIAELDREAESVTTAFGPERRRELLARAQGVARRYVMPWLESEEAQAEELYNAVTARFVHLVNGLLQQISEEQATEFAQLPKSLDGEHGFRTRSRFSFHEMITIAQPASPLLYSLDAILGMLRIRGPLLRDAKQFLERLLDTNASRVQGDVEQRVVESRLLLESEVRKLLRELTSSAERALSQAREVMTAGAEAVAQQMDTLGRLREELCSMNVGG